MTAEITTNALESNRFGVRFARLTLSSEDFASLHDSLDRADVLGIDVISTRVDTLALPTVQLLEAAGFRLMDTLVYYRRAIGSAISLTGTVDRHHVIAPLSATDAPVVAAISRRAFSSYFGHYHADPRLAEEAATDVYADWIDRALRSPAPAQIALGASIDGRLAGFILGLTHTAGASEITLNAVDPAAQRSGLYRALLCQYIALVTARGDHEVLISTQLQNYAVQRIWAREGFLLTRSYHTLHRWAPRIVDC